MPFSTIRSVLKLISKYLIVNIGRGFCIQIFPLPIQLDCNYPSASSGFKGKCFLFEIHGEFILAFSIRRDRSLFAMFFFYDGTLLGLGVTRSSNKLPMFVGIRFEKVITEVLAFCVCLSRRKRGLISESGVCHWKEVHSESLSLRMESNFRLFILFAFMRNNLFCWTVFDFIHFFYLKDYSSLSYLLRHHSLFYDPVWQGLFKDVGVARVAVAVNEVYVLLEEQEHTINNL